MQDALENEELALRRRLLFRLLRSSGTGGGARAETISELVPKGLIAPGQSLFQAPAAAAHKPV